MHLLHAMIGLAIVRVWRAWLHEYCPINPWPERVASSFLKQFDSPLLPGKISTGSLARVIDSMNRLKVHKQHRGIRSRSRPSAHVSRASESRTPYINHGFVALNVGLQVSCFHCVAKTSYFRCPSPFPPMPRQTTGTKHRHHPHSYCSYPMRPWRNRIVSIYHRSTVFFGKSCSDDSRTICRFCCGLYLKKCAKGMNSYGSGHRYIPDQPEQGQRYSKLRRGVR
jgi:hypothetical protein